MASLCNNVEGMNNSTPVENILWPGNQRNEKYANFTGLECQEELPQNDENDSSRFSYMSTSSSNSLPRDGMISSCFPGYVRATRDAVVSGDDRVLRNQLSFEDKFQSNSTSYFFFQEDVKPYMRKMVTSWMLDVFTEQQRDENVFCLSVSLLDKFLSTVKTKKSQLQLVAAVCMFIASKVKEPQPLEADDLVAYTDHSIKRLELLDWEMMVLEALNWDVCLSTAHDFLDLLIERLPIDQSNIKTVMHHAETFVCLCMTEHSFLVYPPSVLAGSCLMASISGLRYQMDSDLSDVAKTLHKITGIDIDFLKACQEQIEQLLHNHSEQEMAYPDSMANHKLCTDGQTACPSSSTPTDVANISLG